MVIVWRVAQAADVDFRAMRQDSANVRVRAESPFAMIFSHPRISDSAEWQVVNNRLKGAFVHPCIPGRRRVQDSLDNWLSFGE